jgi:hypothetical protein
LSVRVGFSIVSRAVYTDNQDMQTSPFFLDPEKVGASLIEVGVDYQEIESREVQTRWFRGQSSETDVFVWMNRDLKMIKQQISVMGLIAEWNILDGVRTGMIMESELSSKDLTENGLTPDTTASEVIQFDKSTQKRTLDISLSILKNMTCLEPELKALMLKNFNQGVAFEGFPERRSAGVPSRNLWLTVKEFFLSCFKK